MSLNIRLKHSATKGKKPQAADLKNGELALNTHSASAAGYALDDTGAVQQMFGKATETQEGQAEIATQPEVDAGTDDERIVTPAKLGQRLTNYTTNTVDTAVSGVDSKITVEENARKAAITAEENARKAADSAEATTRANDDGLRVLKAGDTMTGALSVPAGASGAQAPQVQEVVKKAGDTMTGDLNIPNNVIDNPGVAKAHAFVNVAASNLTTLKGSFNIASVNRTGVGTYEINFATPMADTEYNVVLTSRSVNHLAGHSIVSASHFTVVTRDSNDRNISSDGSFNFAVYN